MRPGHMWLLPRVYPELWSPIECIPLSWSSQDLQLQERVGVLFLGSKQGKEETQEETRADPSLEDSVDVL